MKTITRILAILVLIALAMSCGSISFNMKNYQKAIRSGFNMIPEVMQIEELLGDSDHSISNYGSRGVGNIWRTEVHFYGRYVLRMRVPVRMGYQFDEVLEVLDEPQFLFLEVGSIQIRGSVPSAKFNSTAQRRLTAADWAKVYKANGDFSVIGINLKKDQPVKDFEKYVEAVRRSRVKVDGLCALSQ